VTEGQVTRGERLVTSDAHVTSEFLRVGRDKPHLEDLADRTEHLFDENRF
jgi:hypothetical protein